MNIDKNILIIGFDTLNKNSYPHLHDFVKQSEYQTDYMFFPERGYFLGVAKNLKEKIREILSLVKCVKYIIIFLKIKLSKKYEYIIAIDNFVYIVFSVFTKNITLWSQDFVTTDQEHFNSYFQKYIYKQTRKIFCNQNKLIIQDKERLDLFCNTYKLNVQQIKYFLYPVSLPPVIIPNLPIKKPETRPKLLQIGGINQYRSSSLDLINNYQINYKHYELFLHGFFDSEIVNYLEKIKIMPYCSSLNISPKSLPYIINVCDIGFISYNSSNKNFYYISSASGQLVEFIRMGKPIIVHGNTNLKELVEKHKIGIYCENFDDIPYAIKIIIKEYKEISFNCLKLFNRTYNSTLYVNKLLNWIIS